MGEHNKVNRRRRRDAAVSAVHGKVHRTGAADRSRAPRAGAIVQSEPCLGIIMLDTCFPRPIGDTGNTNSHRFVTIAERVPGAFATAIVGTRSQQEIEDRSDAFVAAGRRLIARGATVIGTSCGFLTPLQAVLARALPVPVALSALLQVSLLERVFGAGRVGVLTFDASTLSTEHLSAADVRPETPLAGLPRNSSLRHAILSGAATIDHEAARLELVAAARRLRRHHPQVRALVLECTNMPPYRTALRQATGLPVYDANTLLDWLAQGLLHNTLDRGRPDTPRQPK